MDKQKRCLLGFTLVELMITIVIIGVLAAIAIPIHQNHTKKAYYSAIISITAPYKMAITECYRSQGSLTNCNTGSHGIPAAIITAAGGVNSITVSGGQITVTPVEGWHGITATDTYVLTPARYNGTLSWTASGGGVAAGYAPAS